MRHLQPYITQVYKYTSKRLIHKIWPSSSGFCTVTPQKYIEVLQMCDVRKFYLLSIYKLSHRGFKYARYISKKSCFLAKMYIKFSLPFN